MQFVRWIHSRLGRLGSISSTALVAALVVPPGAALHLGLASSVPTKGAHLMDAPTEIRLTFTAAVDTSKVGLELFGPDQKHVMTAPARAGDSAQVAVAAITGKLTASGTYTVKWKAVAADGDPATGSFTFMYMPARKP